MNEPIAAVIVGLLLSLSAGVRVTLPLLAVCVLAYHHEVTLPANMAWLGTEPTLIILGVAFIAETAVHFIPAVGTYLKAMATPLAFVAGTLVMAVPLGDHNPLFQWVTAAAVGGGAATLMHLGVTGARTATGPVNLATVGGFGLAWNALELFGSFLLATLSGLCAVAGWVVGVTILLGLLVIAVIAGVKGLLRFARPARGVSST